MPKGFFGAAGSPLVEGGQVIANIGGAKAGIIADTWQPRYGKAGPASIPNYWNSDMLPPSMRHESGHGGSAVFISAEFINALLENREPAVDVYESLAMTVPGAIAHQSALKNGEQMKVPSFDRKDPGAG